MALVASVGCGPDNLLREPGSAVAYELDPSWRPQAIDPPLGQVSGVALDARGGGVVRAFGMPGGGPGELDLVHGIAVDRDDRIYVADRRNARVQVLERDGTHRASWQGPRIGRPFAVAVAGERVFVVDGGDQDPARPAAPSAQSGSCRATGTYASERVSCASDSPQGRSTSSRSAPRARAACNTPRARPAITRPLVWVVSCIAPAPESAIARQACHPAHRRGRIAATIADTSPQPPSGAR